MDVLYVVGKGSKHDNDELRWSLRSIEKFGKNLGRVIVAGEPPEWLSGEVIKVGIEDICKQKQKNIMNCVLSVIESGIVQGEFLYSSDDHFMTFDMDFDNYPYYIKRELPTMEKVVNVHDEKKEKFKPYWFSLSETRNVLKRNGYGTIDFSQHCNTHMHTDDYEEVVRLCEQKPEAILGYEPTCMFMNVRHKREPNLKLERRFDFKILEFKGIDDLSTKCGSRDSFSIDDCVFTDKDGNDSGFRDAMYKLYSWKSRFEI